MKKLFLFAATAAMLAGCSETDELAKNQLSKAADDGAISFSVYTNRAVTRAGKAGMLNTDSLQKPDGGFGVFAYHTNNSFYDSQNSEVNFMYNQKVTWDADNGWTYDPVKYWPNEFGTNAKSNDIDYVTFFAYAPYVDFNPMTGVAPAGDDAAQQQWKNITSASRNGDLGDPLIRYMVDANPQTSVDLLWGVAANKNFQGLAPAATTTPLKEGGCYLNLSKQVGVDDKIEWRFHHALSKLKVEIIAASDIATEGTAEYVPADGATDIDAATRVYLRWIEFQGFAMSGALNLNSATPLNGTVPTAKWMSYDGATDLKITTVRFNDGLFDGKEGIADNVNPNERVLGELNDTIIEKSTPAEGGWQAKNAGIPTAKYTNLFANAKDGKDCIYVIPTSSPVKISMLYDMETADRRVGKYLSDGKTTGVRIANEISKNLDGLKFEAGKAYSIKIVVGLESVKVTAEVVEWPEAGQIVDVDMPYNLSASTQAMVNGQPYESLAAAFAAAAAASSANAPQTIKLTNNTSVNDPLVIGSNQNVTIDLNGKQLALNAENGILIDNVTGATINITNGTVKANGNNTAINIRKTSSNCTVNIASDAKVDGQSILMQGADNTLNINGEVTTSGTDAAIMTNGSNTTGGTINIGATAKITSEEIAMYLPGVQNVTIAEGAQVTGATAIYVKSGSTTINGGTFTGNGTKVAYAFWGNGGNATGDAIVIDNCGYPGPVPSVQINGGTFTSTNADAVGSYVKQDDSAHQTESFVRVVGFINGGTFSSNPSDYVATGKSATETSGTWTVQ